MHDVLADLAAELNETDNNWETRGRRYRAFLRVARASMDLIMDSEGKGNEVDYKEEYRDLRAGINDILMELG